MKYMSKKLSRDPKNYNLRKTYYSNKKHLHQLVKRKLALEKDDIAKRLSSLESDPKEFWKTLEKLQQCSHGRKSECNDISAGTWLKHFKSLMHKSQSCPNKQRSHITDYVANESNWQIFNDLSFKIRNEEITKAINNIKKWEGLWY